MTDFQLSSANDPDLGLGKRQLTLKHYFALIAICSLALLVFVVVERTRRPTKFLAAAKTGDAATLQKYLDAGVDIHYQDGWRTSALMLAASHGNLECVQLLLDNGAAVNERARENGTPLIWAAESGKMDIVELLLERGADPGLLDNSGRSAEQHARDNGHERIAALINSQKAG